MKKSILTVLVAFSFVTCNKNNTSPAEAGPGVNTEQGQDPASRALVTAKLVYVTYDAPSPGTGNSYVVTLDAAGNVLTNNVIGLPPGEKVIGGIARRRNMAGTFDYFITTCNTFAPGVPAFERRLTGLPGGGVSGPTVICPTANTLTDFRNYLRENHPSLNYYFRRAGDILSGVVPGCPGLPTSILPFAGMGGSLSFDAFNTAGLVYSNQHPATPANQGDVYTSAAPALPYTFLSSNAYVSFISGGAAEHCLTVDNSKVLFLIYNGQYVVGGVAKHSILASGIATSGVYPTVIVKDFPCGTAGKYAYITDVEAL